MTEIFYGEWFIQCEQINADFSEQFIISGSDSSDGIYPGTPGIQIARVSGKQWSIEMQWNNNTGSGWQTSGIKRSATYTVLEGLVIRLGADDNFDSSRDFDYNDMILICKSLDTKINPTPPSRYPYGFTIPKDNEKYNNVI